MPHPPEPANLPPQVTATPAALRLIEELKAAHGPILFYQSGGCCEGSAPMCFPVDEFHIGSRDVKMGDIGGVPFYISAQQFEYWKHTQLVIDVTPGFGAAFSLEGPGGLQFLTRSQLFSTEELARLRAAGRI